MRLKHKLYAIKLRKTGKTYREIIEKIPNLSKSTLSNWLKYLELTPNQQKILEAKATQGRAKAIFLASKINREKRIRRMNETIKKAEVEVPKLIKNPLFLSGVILYWCEGTQKTNDFNFVNSNPFIIKIMIKWLNDICKIPKENLQLRLYIHKIYKSEHCEKFWSKELNIPLSQFKITYKPTPHKIKRNLSYKGCLRIRCGGVELFRKFIGWRNGLIKYLKIK